MRNIVSLHVTPCKSAGNLKFSFVKKRSDRYNFRFMPVSSIFCWLVLAISVLLYDRNHFPKPFISAEIRQTVSYMSRLVKVQEIYNSVL